MSSDEVDVRVFDELAQRCSIAAFPPEHFRYRVVIDFVCILLRTILDHTFDDVLVTEIFTCLPLRRQHAHWPLPCPTPSHRARSKKNGDRDSKKKQ